MRANLGPRAWLAILLFIWVALIFVIVAFADITAGTFVGPIEELNDVPIGFESGGAVAFASIAYLLLAVIMGVVQRVAKPPLWLMTAIFVPATLAVVWLGTKCSGWLALSGPDAQRFWGISILGYCFVASLLPMWLLLQPRGYLGGFVLYGVLAVAIIGIAFGGFSVEQPQFRGWVQTDAQGNPTPTGLLFPFLFVTIACGACSGFHGLVCSGTTSKQVSKESHCRPVGYGGMLLEGFVAVIALSTVMIVASTAGKPPGAVYGEGIGRYLTVLIGEERLLFAIVFGSMAFSTFVFDTLDVATRLGRYILQELFGMKSRAGAVIATAITIAAPLWFLWRVPAPQPGQLPAYMAFWTLFGTSNQLLAALTLLGISVWLARSRRPYWFTLLPMLFVMTITVWALVRQVQADATSPNGIVAMILLGLAGLLVVEAVRAFTRPAAVAPRAAP